MRYTEHEEFWSLTRLQTVAHLLVVLLSMNTIIEATVLGFLLEFLDIIRLTL